MVKEVFSNTDQCIHVWAQRNQGRGRNGTRSISFEGDTLVSYSTPIARFQKNKKGDIAALHYYGKYSVTTSAQQSTAWGATSHYPRFSVKLLGDNVNYGRAPRAETTDWHKENLQSYGKRYAEFMGKLTRMRSTSNIDWCKNDLRVLKTEAESYCKFFGIRFTPSLFPEPSAEGMAKIKERAAKEEARNKAALAKREKERREGMRNNITEFLRGAHTSLHWQWKDYATTEEILQVQEYAITQWRAGISQNNSLNQITGDTLLRLHGEEVQTSRGAAFPIEHAKKAWPMIRACKEKARGWHTNGHTIKLGSFGIDEITPNGDIKAGCHTVAFEEAERMAKQLDLA